MRVNIHRLVVHLAERLGAHANRHVRVSTIAYIYMFHLFIEEVASFVYLNQLFEGVNSAICSY